jgi:plastocyanin
MSGRRVAVGLVLGGLALVACGGDDDDAGGGTTTEAAGAATTATGAPSSGGAATGGGSTGGSSTTAAAVAADAVLVVENYTFAPLSVPAGSVVKLENRDAEPHTISSPDGSISFDGETETFTAPATAGTYSYVCGVHAFMEGSLTVT